MKTADIAAACRICAQRQNKRSGVRKIPPPVPVRPDRNPRPAPTPIAVGFDGATVSAGSPPRNMNSAAEKKKTRPVKILRNEDEGWILPSGYEAGNLRSAQW